MRRFKAFNLAIRNMNLKNCTVSSLRNRNRVVSFISIKLRMHRCTFWGKQQIYRGWEFKFGALNAAGSPVQRVSTWRVGEERDNKRYIRLCVGRRTRRAFTLPSVLPFRCPSPSSLLFVNTAVLLSNAPPFHCAQTAYTTRITRLRCVHARMSPLRVVALWDARSAAARCNDQHHMNVNSMRKFEYKKFIASLANYFIRNET